MRNTHFGEKGFYQKKFQGGTAALVAAATSGEIF